MKRAITSAAAVAILTVAISSTGHAWSFLSGNQTYVVPHNAGGDNRQNSHNVYNSKNVVTGSQGNDTSNHSSASARSGGGWGWGWGGFGGSARAVSTAGQVTGGQGSNFGLMGSGGNTNSITAGDIISTGNTYNGDTYLAGKEVTARRGIEASRQIELKKLDK